MKYIPIIEPIDYNAWYNQEEETFHEMYDNFIDKTIALIKETKERQPYTEFYISLDSETYGEQEMLRIVGYDDMPYLIIKSEDDAMNDFIDFEDDPDYVLFEGEESNEDAPYFFIGRYGDRIHMIYKKAENNKEGSIGLTKI